MYLYLRYFVVHVSYMVESTLLSQKQSSAAKLCDNFLKRVSVGPGVRRKGEMKRGAEERRKVCSWGRVSANAVHGVSRTDAGATLPPVCPMAPPREGAGNPSPCPAAGPSLRRLKEPMVTRSRVGCDATGGGGGRRTGVLGRVEIGAFRWWRAKAAPRRARCQWGHFTTPSIWCDVWESEKRKPLFDRP